MSENWWIAIVTSSVGALVVLAGGGIAWMFKVHALLASMNEGLKHIPALFKRTDEHARELSDHGARIKILENGVCQED